MHVDSLEGTAASFLLRVALIEVYTREYADSLDAGNEWWCIVELLDHYIGRVKQDSTGAADLSAMLAGRDSSEHSAADAPVVVEDDILPRVGPLVPTHSGKTWDFWRSLAHYGRGAHELGLWNDLDPEVRRVLEELQAAISPLLQPRDPVTLEPLEREKLLKPKGQN